MIKAMHRMDKQLKWMSMNEATGMVRPEDVTQRETELLASYLPLGEMFCDLHDRPERMLAKGVIRDIVPWRRCRSYFYWRLKRRFEELRLADGLADLKGIPYEAAHTTVMAKLQGIAGDQAAYETLKGLTVASLE